MNVWVGSEVIMKKTSKFFIFGLMIVLISIDNCKNTEEEYPITQADVEYISKTIVTMLHSAQADAISDAISKLPYGHLIGPIDWTPGGDYNGIHIQGTLTCHTDYSADADTTVDFRSVDLEPFDLRSFDMEIVTGDGTIFTHVDAGWEQETFNINMTLRLKAINYDMSFENAILYFDLLNFRLTGTVIFDNTTYTINISFLPSALRR
jgi:hypothetical protein